MQQQLTESQQLQAELNQTCRELVQTQRKLKQSQDNLQLVLNAVLNLAKQSDTEIKTIDDAVNFLNITAETEDTE